MLERGGDLEQLTSGGGIGGEGSSVVRCLHLTSSSVSRDEPNWTHPSVFERKKILVKNGILRSKKTDQIVCGYKAGPPFVRQRVELARLPAHSDQQSLSLPWFKSFMVQQNLKPKVLFCEKVFMFYTYYFEASAIPFKKILSQSPKAQKTSRIGSSESLLKLI